MDVQNAAMVPRPVNPEPGMFRWPEAVALNPLLLVAPAFGGSQVERDFS